MTKIEPIGPYLEPVRESVRVTTAIEETFRLFTDAIACWWPVERYSVSQERTRNVVLEPRVGGALFEVNDDGQTFPWGEVLVWEPPQRLVLSWHPGREPDVAQKVEVRFTTDGGGTKIDLEHRDWARLGEDAGKVRESYSGGWAVVLGKHFIDACATSRVSRHAENTA